MKPKSFCMAVLVLLIWQSWAGIAGSRDSKPAEPPENPFSDQADAILAGRKLYLRNCSHCHGEDALGRNKAASLRAAAVRHASPGVVFQSIRNGNLRAGMPSWSHLSDQRIWQLVTYLHSLEEDPREHAEIDGNTRGQPSRR